MRPSWKLALVAAAFVPLAASAQNPRANEIADAIRTGANAFLPKPFCQGHDLFLRFFPGHARYERRRLSPGRHDDLPICDAI